MPYNYRLGNYRKKEEACKCIRCGKDSPIKEWDNNTFTNVEPEYKNIFTSLTEEKAYDKLSRRWYLCPKCNEWSVGCLMGPKK